MAGRKRSLHTQEDVLSNLQSLAPPSSFFPRLAAVVIESQPAPGNCGPVVQRPRLRVAQHASMSVLPSAQAASVRMTYTCFSRRTGVRVSLLVLLSPASPLEESGIICHYISYNHPNHAHPLVQTVCSVSFRLRTASCLNRRAGGSRTITVPARAGIVAHGVRGAPGQLHVWAQWSATPVRLQGRRCSPWTAGGSRWLTVGGSKRRRGARWGQAAMPAGSSRHAIITVPACRATGLQHKLLGLDHRMGDYRIQFVQVWGVQSEACVQDRLPDQQKQQGRGRRLPSICVWGSLQHSMQHSRIDLQ